MTRTLPRVLVIFFIILLNGQAIFSQAEGSKFKTSIAADLVSTYIWRGTVSDQSPNIQPTFSASYGNFTLGTWASGNFTGTYKEVDLFASYTIKRFTLTVNDYQWSPYIDNKPYFNYNNDSTGHIFEGALLYTGGEKFPLKVSLNTMFYGADKKVNDNGKLENQYSTYVECLYPFSWNGNNVDAFVGFTPKEGYYGNGAGVVNMGFTGYKTIKFTESFSLPVKGSLVFNPQASRAYFVFAVTL